MQSRFQEFSVLGTILLLLFTLAPEKVESQERSQRRSIRNTSSNSRNSVNRSTRNRSSTSSRKSSTARKKERATRPARTKTRSMRTITRSTSRNSSTKQNTRSIRKTTRSQQRQIKAQNRKEVRQLKAKNRLLKREQKRADRNSLNKRQSERSSINQKNFKKYYPVDDYTTYRFANCLKFKNFMFGIYFHDYYNHAIPHSYLWHYHHPDYDRSHWSAGMQAECSYYEEYYFTQGIERNINYVDPGTYQDEDYISKYVEDNLDKFYGENSQAFSVEELPNEKDLKSSRINNTSNKLVRSPLLVLIFGGMLILSIIVVILHHRGYF